MLKEFLDMTGLRTFFSQLQNLFATKDNVQTLKDTTDPLILDIDYESTGLVFDTTAIVDGSASSSGTIGTGVLGEMIIGS